MSANTHPLYQVLGLLRVYLTSVAERRGASLMILVSTAGAVAVLISMLAMVEGLLAVASGTGRIDRAIVMSKDANGEMRSSLSSDAVARIVSMPGIVEDSAGRPLISMDSLVLGDVTAGGRRLARLPVRGLGTGGLQMRSEIKIVDGRAFQSGLRELLVGRMAAVQVPELRIGNHVTMGTGDWLIVGIFESGGSLHESELLTDADTLRTAFHRNQFQSVTVQLQSAGAYETFRRNLEADASISIAASRESEHYARQAGGIRTVLAFVAYFVGTAMAIGGTLAAVNAMYTTVRRRRVEIATLRAIGFSASAILSSVLLEAVVLAATGGLLGILLASVFVDGTIATTVRDGASQLMFALTVTPAIATVGLVWACSMGFIGGLLPAIRAVRIPAATALRMA